MGYVSSRGFIDKNRQEFHFLCYDFVVLCYYIISLFKILWLCESILCK